MSVSSPSSRTGRHPSQPPGPGRPPGAQRRPAAGSGGLAALTVTLSIPLAGEEPLIPAARRLLEAARELVERGEATVSGPHGGERRADPLAVRTPQAPHVPTVHIMSASRTVLLDGEKLPLTRLEFDLLMHLVAHPRRVFTRLQLLTAVWGYEHAGVRTVDVHIRRLRGKVGAEVPLITTVYGVGYRLADDARVVIDSTG
ncbi:winged helix-turn-helix domain-containing protein [Plantactinospora sp. GCM10030261]|uniref:winged helix-turn-helix domain-containing protein n=1 Tax=Plantactinospora sp. GCM10030261 TaxID=3273420 RepID=UPI003610C1F4